MNSPAQSLLFDRVHAALPQTQCTRCAYADCAAYAQAIASGEAAINQCPPGGAQGIARLARITGLPAQSLNPAHGVEGPRVVAVIDEAWCIGCTLCINACPVDAIMGSNKAMHTIIEQYCTGCELCVPVCPVDCISLENVTGNRTGWSAWSAGQADASRMRYDFRSKQVLSDKRKDAEMNEIAGNLDDHPINPVTVSSAQPDPADRKRTAIEAALARARAQRATRA